MIEWRGYLVIVAETSYWWYIENLIIQIIRNSRILPISLKEGFYNVDPKILTSFYLFDLYVLYSNRFGFISLIKSVTVSFVVSKLGKKAQVLNLAEY